VPLVSIIVPCYNEQATIRLLLEALYEQIFPRDEMEVVIADGLSTDSTLQEISAFQRRFPDFCVRVVENAKRNIPAGLNRAIAAAKGEIIVRLDAHSIPRHDYVARCVKALDRGLGENIGGIWEIRPGGQGWVSRGIAAAGSHPLGVGDAHYRYSEHARAVDTVPFGAFRASLIQRIGPYDETLLTNEDYEFNTRIRQSGGRIWLDPAIRAIYFARPDLKSLAEQYWRYGFWKARMLLRYPRSLRWRQALPPVFVLSLLIFTLLSPWFLLPRLALVVELVSYTLALFAAGVQIAARQKDFSLILSVILAMATMHLTWGSAFLWSLVFNRES
jgi:succinoglycan biosynthesis protein ExoA